MGHHLENHGTDGLTTENPSMNSERLSVSGNSSDSNFTVQIAVTNASVMSAGNATTVTSADDSVVAVTESTTIGYTVSVSETSDFENSSFEINITVSENTTGLMNATTPGMPTGGNETETTADPDEETNNLTAATTVQMVENVTVTNGNEAVQTDSNSFTINETANVTRNIHFLCPL